jgi:hypothetical protein
MGVSFEEVPSIELHNSYFNPFAMEEVNFSFATVSASFKAFKQA